MDAEAAGLGPVLIDITPQHSHHATTFSRCGNDHGFGKVRPRARQHSEQKPGHQQKRRLWIRSAKPPLALQPRSLPAPKRL
jgi:hypothetical protein